MRLHEFSVSFLDQIMATTINDLPVEMLCEIWARVPAATDRAMWRMAEPRIARRFPVPARRRGYAWADQAAYDGHSKAFFHWYEQIKPVEKRDLHRARLRAMAGGALAVIGNMATRYHLTHVTSKQCAELVSCAARHGNISVAENLWQCLTPEEREVYMPPNPFQGHHICCFIWDFPMLSDYGRQRYKRDDNWIYAARHGCDATLRLHFSKGANTKDLMTAALHGFVNVLAFYPETWNTKWLRVILEDGTSLAALHLFCTQHPTWWANHIVPHAASIAKRAAVKGRVASLDLLRKNGAIQPERWARIVDVAYAFGVDMGRVDMLEWVYTNSTRSIDLDAKELFERAWQRPAMLAWIRRRVPSVSVDKQRQWFALWFDLPHPCYNARSLTWMGLFLNMGSMRLAMNKLRIYCRRWRTVFPGTSIVAILDYFRAQWTFQMLPPNTIYLKSRKASAMDMYSDVYPFHNVKATVDSHGTCIFMCTPFLGKSTPGRDDFWMHMAHAQMQRQAEEYNYRVALPLLVNGATLLMTSKPS